MIGAPKVTPVQRRTLDGLRAAIVACAAASAQAAAEAGPLAGAAPASTLGGVAVTHRLVSAPGVAHA